MPVELKACHLLCVQMSTWLYSDEAPPKELNQLWLNWVNDQQIPTPTQISRAVAAAKFSRGKRYAR